MSINTIFMIIIAIFIIVVFATFLWWTNSLCKAAGNYCNKITGQDHEGLDKVPNLIPNENLCLIHKPHIQKIAGLWIVSETKNYYDNGYSAGYTVEEAWGYWLKRITKTNPLPWDK